MIERNARIVSVTPQAMQATLLAPAGCAACGARKVCNGKQESLQVELPVLPGIGPGDEVLLGLETRELLRAAVLAYLLPATTLVLGAFVGDALAANPGAIAGAMAGFGLGVLLTRLLASRPLQPHVRCLQPDEIAFSAPES
ncbi:MAG: hypothetical protein CGU28_08210 [Candidatus Dactylopiibacterium carminicum]|uniref:Fis family transcriptional regulator n=1 Tax=Candidatus Dactylopiibacterium carminicum TaxID=857335 RepID=A0A272ES47_9RHOO|nr:SoxR reducing system RseC family protein [Candidatus Dactylopiibacterium carminicum]KAF7598985.1 hypothetical protein BGI27_10260 [Candidatus Dactylopiibacterium carminicum]PAS92948.1 MAG: hypothetical protein CGU29_09590 [Candidatus Dactylopiibacterium carminicum]PAS96598.1 MAG: hypothetical protein CGU28_08210 [Candidatus Dactylopiibacterium carminicum]PAS98997.1 MAG: hypothetical protein BSR46_10295 [Candidatus Dactylopiibacterium carminicum]